MDFEEYQAIDAVNFSSLKHFERSALHYKTHKENPPVRTDALDFGHILHQCVFERDIYFPRLAIGPTLSRGTKKWIEAELESPDSVYVTGREMDAITGMVNSIIGNKTAMRLIKGGKAEVTVTGIDQETGLKIKARLDLVGADGVNLLDLKSCKDARVNAFENDISKFLYHRQGAFHLKAANLFGMPHRNFLLLAVEKTPPYGCMIHAIEPCSMGAGIDANRRDLSKLKECLETNVWPGYNEDIQICSIKPWAMPNEDDE